jgi:hypothetical protein
VRAAGGALYGADCVPPLDGGGGAEYCDGGGGAEYCDGGGYDGVP